MKKLLGWSGFNGWDWFGETGGCSGSGCFDEGIVVGFDEGKGFKEIDGK
jgi:hypothetical protein